jgi:hypothetical protein
VRRALGLASELLPFGSLSVMWCATCQQDVASPATAEAGLSRCGRCGRELAKSEPAAPVAAARASKPRLADDWELDADLRGVERLLGSLKANRIDLGEMPPTRPHGFSQGAHAPRSPLDAPRSPASDANRPKSHSLAWGILAIGLATFACGAVLLGWSFAADRADLWPLGLPLALIGQAGLIIGLMLQLDGLWHSNSQTADTLNELDGELSRVRHATTLLTTTKNASAQSFYAHMAEGASPQLLLADLKGQLDLLAQQMASQRKR